MRERCRRAPGHLGVISGVGLIGTSLIIGREVCPELPVPPRLPPDTPSPARPAPQGVDAAAEGGRPCPHVPSCGLASDRSPHPPPSRPLEMINTLGAAHQYLWTDQLEFSLNPY